MDRLTAVASGLHGLGPHVAAGQVRLHQLAGAADVWLHQVVAAAHLWLGQVVTDAPGSVRVWAGKIERTQVVAAVAAVSVVAGSALVAGFTWNRPGADAAAAERVTSALAALETDAATNMALVGNTTSAAATGARNAQVRAAWSALWSADAALSSSPQAGDVPRAQLDAASGTLSALLTDPRTSPHQVAAVTATLAAPLSGVVDSQTQWQDAEDARVAAEQAATPRASTQVRSGVRSGLAAAPPPAPVAPTVPAGGKQCTTAGDGATPAPAHEIGEAINAYRARNGLPPLDVATSATLGSHATTMADAGGVWHSGADNVVGCIPGDAAVSLVVAWSRSVPHNAQMLRTDVSSVRVGAAARDGWLYGAASFL
ncbi:MAG: hypothetical protein FWE61_03405 [Micrococcales bacterium]|nr:hypothetical protein [Micrococcales bacterium]